MKLMVESMMKYTMYHGDLNYSSFDIVLIAGSIEKININKPLFGIFNPKYKHKTLEQKLLYQDFTLVPPEMII